MYLHSSLDSSVQGGGQSRSFRAHGGPQVMQGQSRSHTYVMVCYVTLCYVVLCDAILHSRAILMTLMSCFQSMAEESMSTARVSRAVCVVQGSTGQCG